MDPGNTLRNARALKIAEQVVRVLGESRPKSTLNPSNLTAAYRLLSNKKVDMKRLLEPHVNASANQGKQVDTPLIAIHNTTEISLGDTMRWEGAGTLANSNQGFLAHLTLLARRSSPSAWMRWASHQKHSSALILRELPPAKKRIQRAMVDRLLWMSRLDVWLWCGLTSSLKVYRLSKK